MFTKMKAGMSGLAVAMSLLVSVTVANAGEAETSASAGSNGRGPGTASATAAYNGDGRGWANTTTRSGNVNYGRGTAFGIDRDGVNFSVSQAIAPRFGPAMASTFNVSIGFNGEVNSSHGLSTASGSRVREVNAGGSAGTDRFGRGHAIATAGGRTGNGGRVDAFTKSYSRRPTWRR